MSKGNSEMGQVRLRCAVCDSETYIWRRKDRLKEPGHVKHMYCPTCMEVRPHVEVKED